MMQQPVSRMFRAATVMEREKRNAFSRSLAVAPLKAPLCSRPAWAAPIMLLWLLGLSASAQVSGKKTADADRKIDYASVSGNIVRFEAVINEVINSTFSSSPFAVVHKAKGVYLQGYGVSFDFLINIHRAVVNTPFGQIRARPDSSTEMKRRRIEELKEKLIRVLQANGEIFRELAKDDNVAIIAYFEDRNFPDEPNANRTIVMSVLKKDLDELGNRNDRLNEFKQRMKIVEY
jgi:hypothetical protein